MFWSVPNKIQKSFLLTVCVFLQLKTVILRKTGEPAIIHEERRNPNTQEET